VVQTDLNEMPLPGTAPARLENLDALYFEDKEDNIPESEEEDIGSCR